MMYDLVLPSIPSATIIALAVVYLVSAVVYLVSKDPDRRDRAWQLLKLLLRR